MTQSGTSAWKKQKTCRWVANLEGFLSPSFVTAFLPILEHYGITLSPIYVMTLPTISGITVIFLRQLRSRFMTVASILLTSCFLSLERDLEIGLSCHYLLPTGQPF